MIQVPPLIQMMASSHSTIYSFHGNLLTLSIMLHENILYYTLEGSFSPLHAFLHTFMHCFGHSLERRCPKHNPFGYSLNVHFSVMYLYLEHKNDQRICARLDSSFNYLRSLFDITIFFSYFIFP
jgi:hypothetical protein